MRFQLVLQLPFASLEDYDALIALEEQVSATLGDSGDVDGHDAGSGEMNIFIFTDEPVLAFARIAAGLGSSGLMANLKAGYRERGAEVFVALYPKDLREFGVT